VGRDEMNANPKIRPSPIAGRWYASNPEQLTRQIDHYLSDAVIPPLDGSVVAVVAPHAGHRYSGKTAAHAFKAVEGKSFDLVVVASPYHSFHPAPLLTTSHQAYATPLGEIKVDTQVLADLQKHLAMNADVRLEPVAFDEEHSIEIELPFLQRALFGDFQLIPLMVRTLDLNLLRKLGRSLADVVRGRSVLLVASTDLSHFYPEPIANNLDRKMLECIASLETNEVLQAEKHATAFACGAGAVTAILEAAIQLGANTAKILHYSTSADETGDPSSVVGYGAVAILRKE